MIALQRALAALGVIAALGGLALCTLWFGALIRAWRRQAQLQQAWDRQAHRRDPADPLHWRRRDHAQED